MKVTVKDFVPKSKELNTDEVILGTTIFVSWMCNKLGLNSNPEIIVYGDYEEGHCAEFRVTVDDFNNTNMAIYIYRAGNAYEMLGYLMHELRHYWQFVNLPDEFMYWSKLDLAATDNPLEIDAYEFCGQDSPIYPNPKRKRTKRTLEELKELCEKMREKIA